MSLSDFVAGLPSGLRILFIVFLAVAAHFLVRAIRYLGEWLLTPEGLPHEILAQRYPKIVTVITILVSAFTFVIYFSAFGFILQELGVSLTAYLASASVIGLTVAFGLQGLVQDVVIGLTLIFSDVLDVGDVVDLGGQTGRVERVGLRFTMLVNLLEQRVYIPNRNVSQINRYRHGYVRAYVDVQLPEDTSAEEIAQLVKPIARGMHRQHRGILLAEPELMGVQEADPGDWRYLRLKFRLWPGQGALLETAFKQRLLAALKAKVPDYADWMVTVTYRAE